MSGAFLGEHRVDVVEDRKLCVQSTGNLREGCTKVAKVAALLRVQSSWTAG